MINQIKEINELGGNAYMRAAQFARIGELGKWFICPKGEAQE